MASVSVSTQVIMPPMVQTVRGAAHVMAQAPATHIWPVGQVLPQLPQFAGSLSRVRQVSPQRV